jgi:hypothetical protein
MAVHRRGFRGRAWRAYWAVAWSGVLLVACSMAGAAPALEFRRIVEKDQVAKTGQAIPREAVRVFVYEGAPLSIGVDGDRIGVDYGLSGCLFDRASGKLVRRLTLRDGWPDERPAAFAQRPAQAVLVGPGVAMEWRGEGADEEPPVVAARESFRGRAWRALQPHGFLNNLVRGLDFRKRRESWGSWTPILEKLNEESWLEARSAEDQTKRYTVRDGLASNIVTHLAAHEGALWAACVDIYEPEKKRWGVGGLCRYDAGRDRWEKVARIDGRPVRWVTLLQTVGDELWAGFREGQGVEGDRVTYGKGLYPGDYRPKTTAIVLARLKNGRWRTFSRAPIPDVTLRGRVKITGAEAPRPPPPTERPVNLARAGDKVMLFWRRSSGRLGGDWRVDLDGGVSLLDPAKGAWRVLDLDEDLDVDVLSGMYVREGEVLASSNRGAHRWNVKDEAWELLDSEPVLRSPKLSAAAHVEGDLWVGCTNQSFGVLGRQGLLRYREKSARWEYLSPERLGTSSPVKRIAALPDGDVYVVFAKRPWFGSAGEFSYHPREDWRPPEGMGRWRKGRWTFPLAMEGVPTTFEWAYKDREGASRTRTIPQPVRDVVAIRERLFVRNGMGVFMGPGTWRKVCSLRPEDGWGDTFDSIEAAPDGRSLEIIRGDRELRRENPRLVWRARYRPGSAAPRFEMYEIEAEYEDGFDENSNLENWSQRGDLLRGWGVGVSRYSPWKRVAPGWAVGPLEGAGVFQTPEAVWIALPGQLIRLDRVKLVDRLAACRSNRQAA